MNDAQRSELGRKIDAGIRASVALALEEHRRAGRKVVIWRDGRIVEVLPEPQEEAPITEVREASPSTPIEGPSAPDPAALPRPEI